VPLGAGGDNSGRFACNRHGRRSNWARDRVIKPKPPGLIVNIVKRDQAAALDRSGDDP
jgi:hypothetical protein